MRYIQLTIAKGLNLKHSPEVKRMSRTGLPQTYEQWVRSLRDSGTHVQVPTDDQDLLRSLLKKKSASNFAG